VNKPNLARLGEHLASEFLQNKGYIILSRNFRSRVGEIDIIAQETDTTVFIEVKARVSGNFGKPEEAVTSWKLHSIEKTANYFMMLNPKLPPLMRIDVISLELSPTGEVKRLEHIKNIAG
jgi:putative endonuclease